MMLITLYTSRIVLNALGVEDYGIYNVVGGFVSLFSVINASLMVAIMRFITFELGTNNKEEQNKIFCTAINIEILMSMIIFIIAETIGLWFLDNKMIIPSDRLFAAKIVYQFSVFTFILNLISIPYRSTIVAHEKMSTFAYLSIIEAIWKLIVAYAIFITPFDKLITYGFLYLLIAVFIRAVYGIYCTKKFEECTYRIIFDKKLFKRMLNFAGWETIGSGAASIRDQGSNILINMFFGAAVNAARAISMHVYSAIEGFVQNFMMALNPQITKSYAQDDKKYLMNLIYKGAQYSFYLMFTLSLPVILNTYYILKLWLNIVPEHTVNFVRITLMIGLVNTFSRTLVTAQNATGKNKWYQIIIGGTNLLTLPFAYISLKMGGPSEAVFIVTLGIEVIRLFLRLPILKRMININIKDFFIKVVVKPLSISLISAFIPFIIYKSTETSLVNFLSVTVISLMCSCSCIYFLGLSQNEKNIVNKKVRGVLHHE